MGKIKEKILDWLGKKHKHYDYSVSVYKEHYDPPKDWIELWHGVYFVKAIWKYIHYRIKYPKYTVRFIHNEYHLEEDL